jgi:hypothetical protein
VLVHAEGAREHARADVRQAEELEEALDRAVLAERAVQDREHEVDLAERDLLPARRDHAELAGGGALGPPNPGAVVGHLGKVLGVQTEAFRVVGLEHEGALAGDADGDQLVAVTVDRPEHPARRGAADRVLA